MSDDYTGPPWQALVDLAHQADVQTPPASAAQAAQTWRAIQARITAESPLPQGGPSMQRDPSQELTVTPLTPRPVPGGREAAHPRVPVLAVLAALLLVVLAAAVFATHPRGGSGTPGNGGHPPTPTVVPAVGLGDLIYRDAAVLSATDAWAVGNGTLHQGSVRAGAISHFDGSHWQIAQNVVFANAELDGISMLSASDGWAVGSQSNLVDNTTVPFLLHYTHGQWVAQTLNQPNTYLAQVQMLSTDDGWARGGVLGGNPVFFHYQHGVWSSTSFPTTHAAASLAYTMPHSQTPGGDVLLQGVHFSSDTEGWAWGNAGSQSAVWHYHNGQWQIALQIATALGGDFLSLGSNSPTDVWVLGTHGIAQAIPATQTAFISTQALTSEHPLSSGGTPVLLHYDGQAWAQKSIDISAGQGFLAGATWLASYGVANQQQVVQGLLLNTAGQWRVTTFAQPVTSVLSVTPLQNKSALAVAADGPEGGPQSLHVLRYANGTWTQVP